MRGEDEQSGTFFSYVSCEARVPSDHPLRLIRAVVEEALDVLSGEFDGLYARLGRPGIAPEKLLQALLLRRPSTRSARKRQLMEQLDYNLLVPLVRRPVDGCAGDEDASNLQQEPRSATGRGRGATAAGGGG